MESLHRVSTSDLERFLNAPGELLEESEEIQIAVATFSETPRSLLEVLTTSDYSTVVEVARLHVNWVGEVREDYREAVSEVLRDRDLGENDRLAVELMRFAPVAPEFLSEWVPFKCLIQGLKNEYMPLRYRLKLLERLSNQGELEARLQVAESRETPVSILELLAGDLDLAVRLAVEFNDNCPSDAIDLVKSQYLKASDWDTDLGELEVLGESNWSWVRLAVAQNPFASEETLMKLAGDEEFRIRLAVAKNPGVSAGVLAVLMEDADSQIKAAIAEHPNATEEILHQLFSTHRGVIQNRENLPASILERFFRETFTEGAVPWKYKYSYLLLKQPNTPTWVLAELGNVDLEALRAERLELEIRNNSTPGISNKWVEDDIRYLKDIATHPQVSEEILGRLAEYPNPKVKLAVARNDLTSEELKEELLEELAVHPEEKIRLELAKDINTPVHILEKIGRFEFYQTKLLREIRETLVSKSKFDDHSFRSTADRQMAYLKHEIFIPENISIDVESWMKIFETPELLEVLENQTVSATKNGDLYKTIKSLAPQWKTVLPNLSHNSIERIAIRLADILIIINSDVKNHLRSVAIAIVGNPKTPVDIREVLISQLFRPSIPLSSQNSDCDVILALIYNPKISEAKRKSYFKRIVEKNIGGYTRSRIAADTRTPVDYLKKLLEKGCKYKQNIAKNPATPEYLLRRIADERDENLWRTLAENPNTPSDLLFRFLHEKVEKKVYSNVSMFDVVLRNPGLSVLERYQLLLEKEINEITAQVHEFMARRSDSPFALAQVVENGNQNAKLTAAGNRNTPASILEQLARDSDEVVSQIAATNPNLPFNTLLELARNSTISVKLSLAYKASYGNTPPTSPQLLEILAEDESEQVRARIAEHPDTPVDILVKLANDSSRDVKSRLTANLNTPVEVLNRLGLEENLVNQRNPNTPGIVLAQAVRNMKSKALADFIKHPVQGSQMPSETLAQLATNTNSSVRYRVASHCNTPATVLRQLARDSYVATIRAVASNSNTFPETLEVLSTNPDFTTRHSVVNNPNVPARVLAQIVMSSCVSGNQPNQTVDMLKSAFPGNNNDVLRIIARNPNTPIEALEILARREFVSPTPESNSILPPTKDDSVVQSLAYNPNLTPEILSTLTQDSSIEVRRILVRHPNLNQELWLRLAEDKAVSVRETVADSNQAPVNVLELLASDEEREVRIKIAKNSNTPLNILERLAGDQDSQVRTAVASNSNLSQTTLEQLANDEKIEVRRMVAENSNTPVNIREQLRELRLQPNNQPTISTLSSLPRIYNRENDDLATLLTEYADSDNAFVRFVTLQHPVTPGEILIQGANSVLWLERYAVAENEATSLELLETLISDGNWIVRAAANQSLLNRN